MKNFLLLSLYIICTLSTYSQDFNLELRTGYGFYNLSDLKSLQLEMLESINIPNLKSVEKFPDNIFYSVSLNYYMNPQNLAGFDFSYYTTGGRNHLKDYSGEYKADLLINGYRLGTKYRNYLILTDKIYFGVQVGGGLIYSSFNVTEKLVIFEDELNNKEYEIKGLGWYIEPSLLLSYNILKGTKIDMQFGYEKDFKGELHIKDNKEQKIGRTSDWTGLKISLGINYSFEFEKKSTDTK